MRKTVFTLIGAALLISALMFTASAFDIVLPDYDFGDGPPTVEKGDVNMNGIADDSDLSLLVKILGGSPYDKASVDPDVNGDGKCDNVDLAVLSRMLNDR